MLHNNRMQRTAHAAVDAGRYINKIMNTLPKSIEHIQAMINNKVMEDINLDYKDSRAIEKQIKEISKDVSAFANSDGGVIIYGVREGTGEKQHLPIEIDEGVDHSNFNRERIEQIIQSNISPTLDNLEIIQIPLNEKRSIFVVAVKKSARAPHQDKQNKRYYKRYNFKSSPMEDYEINDIRLREIAYPPLINIDFELDQSVFVEIYIENVSEFPVTNLTFEFSEPLSWEKGVPLQFEKGIHVIGPKRKISFYYSTTQIALSENSQIVSKFTVKAKYYYQNAGLYVTDSFELDLSSIDGTSIIKSELYHHGNKIEDAITKLTTEFQKLNSNFETLRPIAIPTGLNLSVTTLRNLAHLLGRDIKLEKLIPKYCNGKAFEEVLCIDSQQALSLSRYFAYGIGNESLEDIVNGDDNLLKSIKEHFQIDEKI